MRFRTTIWLIGIGLLNSGCSLVTDAIHVAGYRSRQALNDSREWHRNRRLADKAWNEVCSTGERRYSADYADGFKDGFAEHLFRGTLVTPPVPPARYRTVRNQTDVGFRGGEDWLAGFQHGINEAQGRGLRTFITGASSVRPVPMDAPQFANPKPPVPTAPPPPQPANEPEQPRPVPPAPPVVPRIPDADPPVMVPEPPPASVMPSVLPPPDILTPTSIAPQKHAPDLVQKPVAPKPTYPVIPASVSISAARATQQVAPVAATTTVTQPGGRVAEVTLTTMTTMTAVTTPDATLVERASEPLVWQSPTADTVPWLPSGPRIMAANGARRFLQSHGPARMLTLDTPLWHSSRSALVAMTQTGGN